MLSLETQIKNFLSGVNNDPFSILGAKETLYKKKKAISFRAYLPDAEEVTAILSEGEVKLKTLGKSFIFEAYLDNENYEFQPYKLKVKFKSGITTTFYDSYSFMPYLSEYDLYLWNQGNNYEIYNKLGAQLVKHQGIEGVLFSVWAPNAKRVSVVGDHNAWDGRRHIMRPRGASGVWEIFVPSVLENDKYKFEIITQENKRIIKADPFAFFAERRPKTASVVYNHNKYEWDDEAWLQKRAKTNFLKKPMSVYEIHLGSWRKKNGWQWLNYREAGDALIEYLLEMGFNWVEFLPVAEHPFDASWGYQVTSYYAVTSRFGNPDDFKYLVDKCHQAGIGVIVDWVPAHFPVDEHALARFDGSCLYEHEDPRQGFHNDWETLIFNYGRNEVKNFLVANALFWLDKYHIDALRVDAVASMIYLDYSRKEGEWIPNKYGGRENLEALEFIKTLNTKVYDLYPGAMTIAEESTAYFGVSKPVHLGGLGFMFKWNMGWMHDILAFMSKDSIYRKYYLNNLTFSLLYAYNENFCLPLSHDEVVHGKGSLWGKMPGDDWQKAANLKLLLAYMYGEPGKKLLFMGAEFGQKGEWDHDWELDWGLLENPLHKGILDFVKDLNKLYLNEKAMFELDYEYQGFSWLDFSDFSSTVVSFFRKGHNYEDDLLFVFNFTPVPRNNYRLGVPHGSGSFWQEILNSDSKHYAGSNMGLFGGVYSENIPSHGYKDSVAIALPPLAAIILKRVKQV